MSVPLHVCFGKLLMLWLLSLWGPVLYKQLCLSEISHIMDEKISTADGKYDESASFDPLFPATRRFRFDASVSQSQPYF